MELTLQRRGVSGYRKVYDSVIIREETQDTIVPDAYPDISRIICTGANLAIGSKNLGDGSLKLTGAVHTAVLYMPENESIPRTLSVEVPVQCVVDHPSIKPDVKCHFSVIAALAEARMLNPRKVFLKVELRLQVQVYESTALEIVCGVEETMCEGTQQKVTEQTLHQIVSVTEKQFQFSDLLQPSSSKPIMEELVDYQLVLDSMDAKVIGEKVICKGSFALNVLYRSGAQFQNARYELPFSQIVEAECEINEGQPDIHVAVSKVNCMLQEGCIDLSVEALLQVTVWEVETIRVLNDLYRTDCNLDLTQEHAVVCSGCERTFQRGIGRKMCVCDIPAKSVLYCVGVPAQVVASKENEKTIFSSEVDVRLLYLNEDDAVCHAVYQIPVSFEQTIGESVAYTCGCSVVGEPVAVPVTGGFEVRVECEFDCQLIAQHSIRYVSVAQKAEGEEPKTARPSLIIRMVAPGEDLWDIAKSCHSTIDAICMANQMSSETVQPGVLLLIPAIRM